MGLLIIRVEQPSPLEQERQPAHGLINVAEEQPSSSAYTRSSQRDPGTAPKAVKRQVLYCGIVDFSFYRAELIAHACTTHVHAGY